MGRSKFFAATVLVAVLSVPTIANAALVGRLAATEGGTDYQAYYDTEADLTWLADANAAVGSVYDTSIVGSGLMTWANANAWAVSLDVGGVTDWRLPTTVDAGNDGVTYTNYYQGVDSGYNITSHSELSNMFYNVLGNTAVYDTSGAQTGCFTEQNFCLTNTGPFSNVQTNIYWSATEYSPVTNNAWYFIMHQGNQYHANKANSFYAWAVHSGDVSAVPVPAAVWLFGSGLIGLIGFARKK